MVLRFDLEAIALDVDNPDPIPDGCRTAARRPFAIADPNPASVAIDRFDNDDDFAEEPRDTVVEVGVRRIVIS